VNLHTDIPTRADVDRLLASRHPASVSLYLPTDPAGSGQAERIELGNLATEARRQLEAAEAPKADVEAISEALAELAGDDAFWRYQGRSLAVLVTPDGLTSFRLPNRLVALAEVSDRFHVKPLLRAITFPQVAYVLALAQGSVRVIEALPEGAPFEVSVAGLPSDAASAVGMESIADRAPRGGLQGAEGQKVRLRQYARQVDRALRPFLRAQDVPLILAAAEPIDSIYRSVNTYPRLASEGIAGNPETTSDAELVDRARGVLDGLYAQELRELRDLYDQRGSQGRAAADVADVAHAATIGAVDTVFVDIDETVPGSIDNETGEVTFADSDDAVAYGVIDEIARRVWLTGGRVLAVRRDDVPGEGPVAAILRYAPRA
jgi:Bacterial archaeo-eukaryotic release factor family 11